MGFPLELALRGQLWPSASYRLAHSLLTRGAQQRGSALSPGIGVLKERATSTLHPGQELGHLADRAFPQQDNACAVHCSVSLSVASCRGCGHHNQLHGGTRRGTTTRPGATARARPNHKGEGRGCRSMCGLVANSGASLDYVRLSREPT